MIDSKIKALETFNPLSIIANPEKQKCMKKMQSLIIFYNIEVAIKNFLIY